MILKFKFICLFLFISNSLFAESYLIKHVKNGNWNYFEERNFSDILYEIIYCDKDELRILRNAFYAKYNFIFKSSDLQIFFNQLDWYKGTKENVESYLSDREKMIISTIQKIEANYPKSNNDKLIGFWIPEIYSMIEDYIKAIEENDTRKFDIVQANQLIIYQNGVLFFQDYWYYSYEDSLIGKYYLWSFYNNEFKITLLYESPIHSIRNESKNMINKHIIISDYIYNKNIHRKFLKCNFTNDNNWIRINDDPYLKNTIFGNPTAPNRSVSVRR
jgi:hypothetical protein